MTTTEQHEILKDAVRETRLGAGVASEVAMRAAEYPEGLPLEFVRESLRYWREHLETAVVEVTKLESLALANLTEPEPERAITAGNIQEDEDRQRL